MHCPCCPLMSSLRVSVGWVAQAIEPSGPSAAITAAAGSCKCEVWPTHFPGGWHLQDRQCRAAKLPEGVQVALPFEGGQCWFFMRPGDFSQGQDRGRCPIAVAGQGMLAEMGLAPCRCAFLGGGRSCSCTPSYSSPHTAQQRCPHPDRCAGCELHALLWCAQGCN
jgi:hypothetical protein